MSAYSEDFSRKQRQSEDAMWRVVLRLAQRLIDMRAAGYMILEDGRSLPSTVDFELSEEYRRFSILDDGCRTVYFHHYDEPDCFGHSFESVKEVTDFFKKTFTVVKPLQRWPSPSDIQAALKSKDES